MNEVQELRKEKSEKYVIASLIQNPDWIDKALETIDKPERFQIGLHQDIYRQMMKLHAEGQAIDTISLSNGVKSYTFTDVASLLSEVVNEVPLFRLDALETHLTAVAESYVRIQLALGVETASMDELKQYLAQLERKGRTKLITAEDLTMEVFGDLYIEQAKLKYPFTLVQNATNGIANGQVIIVAGRPSAGKSTFLQNVAVSLSQEVNVLLCTNEMSSEQIGRRILSQITQVNMFDDVFRRQDKDEIIADGLEKFSHLKLTIFELQNVAQLERQLKENKGKYDVVLIDYLQLMEPKIKQKDMYNRATQTINELTHLAKDYNLPFVIACQYNRQADKLQPTMADLRESGQIEQNADVIISLWNDEDTKKGLPLINLDILKNRNGSTFMNSDKVKFRLNYNKPTFTFSNSLGGVTYGTQKPAQKAYKPYND